MAELLHRNDLAALECAAAEPLLDRTLVWAAINSGSRNSAGLARMASLLADAFAALPGEIRLEEPGLAHGRHLHLRVRPEAPVQLLLTGHMDTVFAADDPFQMVSPVSGGIVVGPGVNDMKGGIALMLGALIGFETSPDAANAGYSVVINADEEIGSPGSAPLIAASARGKQAALTYEPTLQPDGMMASSRPGSGNFAIAIRGRAAHAGRNPEDGRNAILAAADLALRLAAGAGAGLSVNPARIDGGGANNVVPAQAVLHVNMRPGTPDAQHRAQALLDEAIAEIARHHDVRINLEGGFGRPPKPIDPSAERLFRLVQQCGTALGLAVAWQPSGGVCDGNNIAACGVPVIDTMGTRGGAIHSSHEYLIVDSLAERARLSTLVLLRLARGEFQ